MLTTLSHDCNHYTYLLYVYIVNKTKILCGQLNCLVKLADFLIRCSSHPRGKSEARCEKLVQRGYCTGMPMGLSVEGEAPEQLALARLHPPLVYSSL